MIVLVGLMFQEAQLVPKTEPWVSPCTVFVKLLVVTSNSPYSIWTLSTFPVPICPQIVIFDSVWSLLSVLIKFPSLLVDVFATANLRLPLELAEAE